MKPGLLKFNRKLSKAESGGFGIIEIIVASAIVGIIVFSMNQVNVFSLKASENASNRIEAVFLLNEGVEAIRFIRDKGWNANISPLLLGTDYFLSFTGTDYQLTTTAQPLISGKFGRTIRVFETKRNIHDDIDPAGTVDPLTKKFVITISWPNRTTAATESIEFYLTDLFDN